MSNNQISINTDSKSVTPEASFTVEFYDIFIPVFKYKNQPYIPIKTIVEGIGLQWQPQHRKLNAAKQRWGITMMVIPSNGDLQDTTCLPLRKLSGWLMTIQPSRIKDQDIRKEVIKYQNECDDILWEYWSKKTVKPIQQVLPIQDPTKAVINPEVAMIPDYLTNLKPEAMQQVKSFAQELQKGKTPIVYLPPMLNCESISTYYLDYTLTLHYINGQTFLAVVQLSRIMQIDFKHQSLLIRRNPDLQHIFHKTDGVDNLLCLPVEQGLKWLANINIHKLRLNKQTHALQAQYELPNIIRGAEAKLQKLQTLPTQKQALRLEDQSKPKSKPQTERQLIRALEKIKGGKVTVIMDSKIKSALKIYKQFDDQIMAAKLGSDKFLVEMLGDQI